MRIKIDIGVCMCESRREPSGCVQDDLIMMINFGIESWYFIQGLVIGSEGWREDVADVGLRQEAADGDRVC